MASRRGALKAFQNSKSGNKMNRDRVLQVHRESQSNTMAVAPPVKRSSDSPEMNAAKKRRTAFVDLTNAKKGIPVGGKKGDQKKPLKKGKGGKRKVEVLMAVPKRPASTATGESEPVVPQDDVSYEVIELSQEVRASQDSNSSRSSSSPEPEVLSQKEKNQQLSLSQSKNEVSDLSEELSYVDIDAENLQDPYQVALYAHHIFKYYQAREEQFKLSDYMSRQKDLTANMRAILVDWLVEVQENFELNHETLYLAVKIVDQYLNCVQVTRDRLQLIGATALFISCKFDERCPPVLDDFLYICDDAYLRKEMLDTEKEILRKIGFDIGYPLSYRFLRRYAKCAHADMHTLTLGRYILEMSLMDYSYTQEKDSLVAAAALFLALKMKEGSNWDQTLVHYTGYKKEDLVPLVARLNGMISAPANKQLTTIRSKYSHTVFHEVAKVAPLTDSAVESLATES